MDTGTPPRTDDARRAAARGAQGETPAPRGVLEVRLHGRGGQGGVTCAKILAAVWARLGKSVQTFGDYAGERSGAPVRAYTRVSDAPITDRNKVYRPDHLLVLDPTLLGDEVVAGLAPGGTLLVNTPKSPDDLAERFAGFRVATVDATAIARRHGIGTRSVVIVNTTIAGAFARAMGLPFDALDATYRALGFAGNLEAAREAYESVAIREAVAAARAPSAPVAAPTPVLPLVDHREGAPPPVPTGNWRTQTPAYVENLAPCSAWCPAGNDVVGFVQAVARDGENAAAAILGRTTALSAVCGRVCPAPCMEGCNRREYDGTVNIRGLERWIADHSPVADTRVARCDDPRRVAIVGGGPAGLSAAYTLARLGHRVTIFEGEAALGGVLRTGIPTYRLPRDVLDREIAEIVRLGVEVRCGEFLTSRRLAGLARRFDAVILATGLQKLRGLDVEGADLESVEQGIRFLHRVNLEGGSALARRVVVLGGGNTAIDCARSALRCGAAEVTVVYRRTREEMPAIAEEVEEAQAEGVRFVFLRAPAGFRGDRRVRAVVAAVVELGEPDATGRRAPVVTDRLEEIPADAVLLALGQSADLSALPRGWTLEDGRVRRGNETLPVFAAGDVATGDGTVAHAIGDGRRAATRALAVLGVAVHVFERPDRTKAVPITDLRLDHFAKAPPAHERFVAAEGRLASFDPVNLGLPDALEAHRCFSCGHCTRCDTCLVYCPEGVIRRGDGDYSVDYANCKGCGICVTECPRRAMEMTSS
jgi:2-oxoacid:acceptor oxidoreductase gamma subunit (pyruvate/2-ketoisovalerate family)